MRRRLLAGYLAITAVTLVLLVVPLGLTFGSLEEDRLFRDIEQDATVVASLSEDALEGGTKPQLQSILDTYDQEQGGRIVVVDRSGRSVADSRANSPLGADFTNRTEISAALGGDRAEGRRYSETLQADLVYVAVPVASGGQVHGAVRITYPSSTLDRRVRSVWLGLALLSLVVVIAVTGIGLALTRLVTMPVERLKDAARRIAAGDLSARAPTGTGVPELQELAEVFNETADRQQQLLEAQRAFIGDASHQIRTPLAALRLQLENVESMVPMSVQPAIATARAETARLGRISEGLLALTRASSSVAPVTAVNLTAVIDEREQVWAPIAADNEVRLTCERPDELWFTAADGALEQIIDNLVDNALDVSPAASSILISARATGGNAAELSVRDQGPGLTDAQRARAFDRFWRGPDATPGGTGLGLAIVAQLAEACGGTARLDSPSGGGLEAVITLPTTEPIQPS